MTDVRPPAAGTLVRLAPPAAVLAAVAGAFAYVGTHDPHQPGHYPPCPLLRFTGLYCPGCGGLRAAHALAHGDPLAALGANAVVLVGVLAFAVLWTWWCVRVIRARPVSFVVRPGYVWLSAGLWAVFAVVRNLPFGAALAP